MDKIDQKLLMELDKNPRISMTQLAKKVLVSQQVADYRLKRFINDKKITQFGTLINLNALGFEHYRIFLTFNSKKEYSYEKIFEYLKHEEGVYWSAQIGGKYDLLIAIFVKDFEQLDCYIDKFNNYFPGLIKDYKSCYSIEHEIFKHKYLSIDNSNFKFGINSAKKQIDKLDFRILSHIKNNCRMSALQIAEKERVSYKTIINRIKILEKEKIILGYRLYLSSQEYNPSIILFSFKEYTRKNEEDLLNSLRANKSATQVMRLFGIWNLFVHFRTKSSEELQNILVSLRDRYPIIDNFEIIPIFKDISINLFPVSHKSFEI